METEEKRVEEFVKREVRLALIEEGQRGLRVDLTNHAKDDKAEFDEVNKKIDGINRYLLSTLTVLVLNLVGTITAISLAWKGSPH